MIEVVNFSAEHLELIKPREGYYQSLERPIQVPTRPLHTFLIGQTPIAIFGGSFIHAKFFQVWALFSEDITIVPLEFYKKTKRLLEAYMSTYHLNRLEIQVREGMLMAERFAHSLGFRFEGTLQHYGPDGANYLMYARTQWPK